ncbi:MAG: DUF4198 domain-containing protein [Campylobacterales bacterium]|nr:DUF4198 domain-containing protein [Campylobacterales bacterium]
MKKIFLAIILSVYTSFAIDPIWLSEITPSKKAKSVEAGCEKCAAKPMETNNTTKSMQDEIGDTEGSGDTIHNKKKQIWVRKGFDTVSAKYVCATGEKLLVYGKNGAMPSIELKDDKNRSSAKMEFAEKGFYNLYLVQKEAKNDVLALSAAKYEMLYGTCCSKDVNEDEAAKPIINPSMPFEIVRKHYPKEGLFTRVYSGDTVEFTVFSYGKPVVGANVSIVSHKGWKNTKKTDENGSVSFVMVKDYYPAWSEFKKYFKQNYLVVAEYNADTPFKYEDKEYPKAALTATLSGHYYPSTQDYRSYAWGLGIALFVIVFGSLAVYMYRRRRLKPYKQERVNDNA